MKNCGFTFEYWIHVLNTYEMYSFSTYEEACLFCDKQGYDHEEILVMVF